MSFRGGFSSEAALALDSLRGDPLFLQVLTSNQAVSICKKSVTSILVTAIYVFGLYLLPPCAFPPGRGVWGRGRLDSCHLKGKGPTLTPLPRPPPPNS